MGLLKKLLGICETSTPVNEDCWKYSNPNVEIALELAPELSEPGSAVRLEKKGLPERILLIKDHAGSFRAFKNRCTHMGRRIDPVRDSSNLKCCSLSGSLYDSEGNNLSGPAKKPLNPYSVRHEDNRLTVFLK